MQHEDARAERDANDRGGAQPQLGTGRSVGLRPAVSSPVLGSDVSNRSWLLHGWPDAARANPRLPDTVPLKRTPASRGAAVVEEEVVGYGSIAISASTVDSLWIREHRW